MGINLSTVANVKAYLAITTSSQDALIAALLPRESRTIENYVGRSFSGLVTRTAKRFNGTGSDTLYLPDAPVIALQSLTVDGTAISESPDGILSGYLVDDEKITLIGTCFTRGRQNVIASWTSGYQGSETDTIPTDGILQPTDGGLPVQAASVVEVGTGTVFTLVDADPVAGQYRFEQGTFTFAVADANRSVVLNYYCVPAPIEQACIEMVGLDLKQRDNLGISSKTLAGESISYTSKGMTDSVKEMLNPYRRWMPA